ncbi:glycosyltransferase family 2 protein, partial [Salmonella enterica subsp. enterica serovar Infantis]
VERSGPRPDRQALVERTVTIHTARRDTGFTGYGEYRQQRDVVITTLLTSQPDPPRGTKMAASPDMLAKWASSLRNCG